MSTEAPDGGNSTMSWPIVATLATVAAIVITGFAVDPSAADVYGPLATIAFKAGAGIAWGTALLFSVLSWFGR